MRLSMHTLYLLASTGDESADWALAYMRAVSVVHVTTSRGVIAFRGTL